ncbi:DUF3592 domain-containing protein [Bremerella sp. JC770]|uniref:DUF3592 domain-containing protein n=1 Tax=Bremerella sp. JC770 TaxID=3232137 RepID=UPI003457556F
MPRWFRIWEKKRGSRRTVSRVVASVGETFFFSAIFFFGVIFTAMAAASTMLETWPIRTMFPEVAYVEGEATVQEIRVVQVGTEDYPHYQPEALVLLDLPQRQHHLWTLRRSPLSYSTEEAAWNRLDGYEPGWIYPCWYDPSSPGQSVILERTPAWGLWVIFLVLISFIVIGGIGLIYTLLLMGTSVERRSAIASKAKTLELLREAMPATTYPSIPNDANLTNSPGVRLAFRLPIEVSPGWWLLATLIFSLLWSGMAGVFFIAALGNHLAGKPDWMLTIISLPTIAIALAAISQFLREVTAHTRVGPTGLEISNHPLYPGKEYRVFVTQAGKMKVRQLQILLVCEEAATFLQGTDVRSETKRVVEEEVAAAKAFEIKPGLPFEADYQLKVPEGCMHSFKSDHNAIHWKLVVQINADHGTRLNRSFPIVVYPAELEAAR